MARTHLALFIALGAGTAPGGCKGKEPAPAVSLAPAPRPATPAPEPPGAMGSASVRGTVKLAGKAPVMKKLDRSSDPFCARTTVVDEEVVTGPGGGLANVLVRVTKGVSGVYPPPVTNAVVDQVDCMFRPRVLGIMAGQNLLVKNDDQTLHNVHAFKGAATIFNRAQVQGLPPFGKKFNEPGQIVKLKCDVHPWMTGYVAVSSHPFFAVTDRHGAFAIEKLPGGNYTVQAWHERFGTRSVEVTVAAGSAAKVELELPAPAGP